jgi:hypothetical protein
MKAMPYTISDTDATLRTNTGHDHRWDCAVADCDHHGTALTVTGAAFVAARHSASHTDEELASTGYVVRFNWAAAAAARLADER